MFITVLVQPGVGYDDGVAERMLEIALGPGSCRVIDVAGKQYIFWKCKPEYVRRFEATCRLFKIPVVISVKTMNKIEPYSSLPTYAVRLEC